MKSHGGIPWHLTMSLATVLERSGSMEAPHHRGGERPEKKKIFFFLIGTK
jgi:hypothetical protein